MLAILVAPDLLRDRGGPNVATLAVRAERPAPTSRHFTVTVANLGDHAVVAACTASVTNPEGTREVARARFALGPIASEDTASYEGRLRWVGKRTRMASGISVGCTQKPA
jgi:hypothetical protein